MGNYGILSELKISEDVRGKPAPRMRTAPSYHGLIIRKGNPASMEVLRQLTVKTCCELNVEIGWQPRQAFQDQDIAKLCAFYYKSLPLRNAVRFGPTAQLSAVILLGSDWSKYPQGCTVGHPHVHYGQNCFKGNLMHHPA